MTPQCRCLRFNVVTTESTGDASKDLARHVNVLHLCSALPMERMHEIQLTVASVRGGKITQSFSHIMLVDLRHHVGVAMFVHITQHKYY